MLCPMCDSSMDNNDVDDTYCHVCGWHMVDDLGLSFDIEMASRDLGPMEETLPESEPIDSQLPDEPISPIGE